MKKSKKLATQLINKKFIRLQRRDVLEANKIIDVSSQKYSISKFLYSKNKQYNPPKIRTVHIIGS